MFMTSVLRSNCCTVLSLGTVGLHTPVKLNHTKFLIKLKTEINDQYPIDYTLPSSSSLPRRGTYIIRFEKFSFNGFGNSPAVRWKVIPSSSRNSACFILPVGLGFGCSFFFKTKLNSSYLDRLQGIEFVLDQLRYSEITSLAQSVRPYS